MNTWIDENVIIKKDIRDSLEKMYRAYDHRYGYYRNLGRSFSSDISSLSDQPLV